MTSEGEARSAGFTSFHNEQQCRICLADISSRFYTPGDSMIQEQFDLATVVRPCMCRGSIEFVHQRCLKRWVFHSQRLTCQVCLYKYKIARHKDPLWKICRRVKKQKNVKKIKAKLAKYGLWTVMAYLFLLYVGRVISQTD